MKTVRPVSTEQENLASLIGEKEDREPIDSGSMIFEGLKQRIGSPSSTYLAQAEREESYENAPVVHERPVKKASQNPKISKDLSTEKVLGSLYTVYDGLIDIFEKTGLESKAQETVISTINEIIACIRYVGGTVEDFDPYNYLSGLETPDFYKAAQKVIETTKQCYKKGNIIEPNVSDDGKTINIAFSGETKDVAYVAYGKILCEQWNGNEAIDYIYSTTGGKMTVKIFESGKWTDCTSKGNYNIVYELEEIDKSNIKDIDNSKKDIVEKSEKNINNEKEVALDIKNKLIKEEDLSDLGDTGKQEIQDFPVNEKQET